MAEAAEVADVPPLAGLDAVRHVLAVCGFQTAAERASVIAEGFDDVSDFGKMRAKNFASMAQKISRIAQNRGGFRLGEVQVRNLEALAYWVRDHKRRNEPIVAETFTVATRDEYLERADAEDEEIERAEAAQTPLSGKFEASNWVQWEVRFTNYLAGLRGITRVPLNYVIRKDEPEGHTFVTETERLIYAAPLVGRAFESDTQSVYRILKAQIIGTDAWEWIKSYDRKKDGRLAFRTLRQHYDGPGEVDKRIALARQQVKELHYRSEQTFPFETFITKLNGAFQILAECNEEYTERAKVDQLITGMSQCTNPAIIAATTTIGMDTEMRSNFVAAANKMTEVVTRVFPAIQLHRRGRNVASVDTAGGRGRGRGRGGGRGRGRGHGGRGRGGGGGRGRGQGRGQGGPARGRGGRSNINNGPRVWHQGVDITDFTRYYDPTLEWPKLGFQMQNEIRAAREEEQSTGRKRSIAEINALVSAQPNQQASQPADDAGNSFGRGSYPKRTRFADDATNGN